MDVYGILWLFLYCKIFLRNFEFENGAPNQRISHTMRWSNHHTSMFVSSCVVWTSLILDSCVVINSKEREPLGVLCPPLSCLHVPFSYFFFLCTSG